MPNRFQKFLSFANKLLPAKKSGGVHVQQVATDFDLPFISFFGIPFYQKCNFLDVLRSKLPVVGSVVNRYNRLVSMPKLDANGDKNIQKLLDEFVENVQVGDLNNGLHVFLSDAKDSIILKGAAITEAVPLDGLNGLKLLNTNINQFSFKRSESGQIYLVQFNSGMLNQKNIELDDYVQYTVSQTRDGDQRGVSLFEDCSFIADLWERTLNSLRNTVWRKGFPIYLSLYKAHEAEKNNHDRAKAVSKGVANQITESLKKAKLSVVQDVNMAALGDIRVETLGADGETFDFSIPFSAVMDQIVSVSGFTPQMLGFNVAGGTYDINKAMMDQIVATVDDVRKSFTPLIRHLVNLYLIFRGRAGADFSIDWNPVVLRNKVDIARARQLNSTALKNEFMVLEQAVAGNYMSFNDAQEWLSANFPKTTPTEKSKIVAYAKQMNFDRAALIAERVL